jgi:hypothetical protein
MPQGFVYILVSPNSDHIKIGGTERPISERLRGINGTESYAVHGPWQLSDFLHVTDWRLVEGEMHRHFKARNVRAPSANELFSVPSHEARKRLRQTSPTLRVDHEKTDALLKNRDVKLFLFRLFEITGLFGNLDIQGAWTLSSMPKTSGGRWFTLNIGPHEVAFSTQTSIDGRYSHYLVMDRLILNYPDTILWLGQHGGSVEVANYSSSENALLVKLAGSFAEAECLFHLKGVRRALVAYWADSLADLRERDAKSVYARYHSYDAVAELLEYKRSRDNVFTNAIEIDSL